MPVLANKLFVCLFFSYNTVPLILSERLMDKLMWHHCNFLNYSSKDLMKGKREHFIEKCMAHFCAYACDRH